MLWLISRVYSRLWESTVTFGRPCYKVIHCIMGSKHCSWHTATPIKKVRVVFSIQFPNQSFLVEGGINVDAFKREVVTHVFIRLLLYITTRAQFHKAAKHENLLSIKCIPWLKQNYQQNVHMFYIAITWVNQFFVLSSSTQLGSVVFGVCLSVFSFFMEPLCYWWNTGLDVCNIAMFPFISA